MNANEIMKIYGNTKPIRQKHMAVGTETKSNILNGIKDSIFTIKQAAEMYDISNKTIETWIRKARLKC